VFAGPTWSEQPLRWWPPTRELIARHATADRGTEVDARDRADPERISEDAAALDELLDGLAANPDWVQVRIQTAQIIDLRRRTIRRLAEEAGDLLERRERTKAAVLAIGGVVRRLHLELGRRLVRAGVLEAPEDVELLGEHELASSLRAGRASAPSMAELARRRRWLARCDAAGPLPADFEGDPDPARPPAASGDRFHGWSASPGRAEGPARVLRDSTAGGLQRGDVLVATTTDASWAPLFMSAAAVVVEEGGPLSHAAILARELGIPAVVNLPGIVARLEHEQRVVAVDGDLGEVTVLDDEAEGPGSP
jgi:pyruvate,water dikinase